MSTDRAFSQKFICNSCNQVSKDVIWESEIYKQLCSCGTLENLEPIFQAINEAPSIGGKFKGGRSAKEKSERRSNDFKTNILPTIGGFEKRHFEKKLGKLGQKYK